MHPRVIRLVSARFISDAGSFCALFVGIWGKATFRLHATPGQMAINAAIAGLTAIAGGLVAGVLIDRSDPRRVLVGAEAFAVPAILALTIPETIWTFIAAAAAASFFGGFIMTSVAAFAPHIAEEADLARTNIAIEAAAAAAMVAGPAIGALIAKTIGIDGVFVFDAATSAVAVALLVPMRLREIAPMKRTRALAELRDGLRFTFRTRAVRLYVLTGATIWFSFGAFSALEPLFYREVLHSGPALLGWVLSVFGGGLLAGSLALNRVPKRLLNARTMVALVLALSYGQIMYVATARMGFVMLGNVVWGVSMGACFPLIRTLVQSATPERLVGRVMGTSVTLNRGFQLLPLTVVGALAAVFGVQRVLVGSGVALAVLAAVFGLAEAARVDAIRVRIPEGVEPAVDIAEPATRGVI